MERTGTMQESRLKEPIRPFRYNHFKEQEKFRCRKCKRLLAKSNGNGIIAAEIKCRCGEINER